MVTITIQTPIAHQYSYNSSTVCGKSASSSLTHLNSTNISLSRSWTISIPAVSAHSYAIWNVNVLRKVSDFHFQSLEKTKRFEFPLFRRSQAQNRFTVVIYQCINRSVPESIVWWTTQFHWNSIKAGGKYAAHSLVEGALLPLESQHASTRPNLSTNTWASRTTRTIAEASRWIPIWEKPKVSQSRRTTSITASLDLNIFATMKWIRNKISKEMNKILSII